MELGIDSFAAAADPDGPFASTSNVESMANLLARVVRADEVGLDVFGIGEHHRPQFLDSAPSVILGAAAAQTKRIKVGSAVTVLSAADPVRVLQQFSTIDLISNGRAEMVVGRGSFTESFPLFGFELKDYNDIFEEKLELLLKLRDQENVTWKGRFRPALSGQGVYPRPVQSRLPIWRGVGGTPESFVRAGMLGLPLMVAIIGGETHRFRPLVDLYREAGKRAGHAPEQLKVGIHSLGYVAPTVAAAHEDFFPGYKRMFTKIGRERGWSPVSRQQYDAQVGTLGALVVGGPQEVADKISRHAEALGGVDRFTFQMDMADVSQDKLLRGIELLAEVKSLLS